MGKKNRAKHGHVGNVVAKQKKHLMKLAVDLFKLCVYSPSLQEEWNYFIQVHNAVEEFRKRQKAVIDKTTRNTTSRASLLPTFKSWLKDNGVTENSIEIHDFGEVQGFGIIATEDIKANQELVIVPRKIMITYEDAKKSYLGDLIKGNEVLSVMPNVCLALYLHCEKHNPTSKYKPYIDIFPHEFNTTLYFTPDELKHLKGSSVLSSAIKQYRSIVRQFSLLYQVFNGNKQTDDVEKISLSAREAFTFDSYRWCVSAVTTRQNKIPISSESEKPSIDGTSTLALIPFWDMFNHDIGPMSTSYNCETDQLECSAMSDFNKGEQVMICYGGRSNSDLLVHNGFVVADNPFDKVKINLGVSTKDLLYMKKVRVLSRLNYEASGQFPICSMNGNLPTSPDLLAFLRVFHMNEDELDDWILKEDSALSALKEVYVSGSHPIQFHNDLKMWKYLEDRVNLLLLSLEKKFETNIEEMLQDESMSPRAKLCLSIQQEEKRVLSACVGFCHQFRLAITKQPSSTSDKDGQGSQIVEENTEKLQQTSISDANNQERLI